MTDTVEVTMTFPEWFAIAAIVLLSITVALECLKLGMKWWVVREQKKLADDA